MSEGGAYPERPHVPLVMSMTALTILCCHLLTGDLRDLLTRVDLLLVACVVVVLALVSVVALVRAKADGAPWTGVVAALGFALAASLVVCRVTVELQACATDELESCAMSRCRFEVQGDTSASLTGWQCTARAICPSGASVAVSLRTSERLRRWDVVQGVGTFQLEGDDEWGRAARAKGVMGSVSLARVQEVEDCRDVRGLIEGVRERLVELIDPAASDARALACGCILGWRAELKADGVDDVFADVGLAHLIAVSGAHLALFSTLVGAALGRTRLGPVARGLVLLLVTFLFVILCGAPVSALRAWAMSVPVPLLEMAGRRGHGLSCVALVAGGMALLNPCVTNDLGYLLSVMSVCALALFCGHARAMLGVLCGSGRALWRVLGAHGARKVSGLLSDVRSQAAASLVASSATLPLTCVTFGRLPLIGVVAATLCSVPFELVMVAGLVLVPGCLWNVTRTVAVCGIDVVFGSLLWLVRAFSVVPMACVAIDLPGWVSWLGPVGCVAMLLLWPRPTRRHLVGCLLVVCVAALVAFASSTLLVSPRVVVLDVGQGDAILIRDGPRSVLVDTGPADAVVAALARQHVTHLDAVVLTHLHDDHTGGLSHLKGIVSVDAVWVGQGVAAAMGDELRDTIVSLTGAEAHELCRGDIMRAGSFVLRDVWPQGSTEGDVNADSVCLALSFERDDARMDALLTGDAESEQLEGILEAHDIGDIDLLKVGHHGSKVSITPQQAVQLDPEVAVASAGEGNSYGHPDPECIKALEASNTLFVCTMQSGDVTVRPGCDGVVVSCARDELAYAA